MYQKHLSSLSLEDGMYIFQVMVKKLLVERSVLCLTICFIKLKKTWILCLFILYCDKIKNEMNRYEEFVLTKMIVK